MTADGRQALQSSAPSGFDEEGALDVLPIDETSTETRQILESLGVSPWWETWLALDFRRNRRVVVKSAPIREGRADFADAFVEGAREAARSSPANLALLLDIERKDGRHEIVRAYVPGKNLDRLVDEGELRSQTDLYRLFATIAESLARLHRRGIVHGNLKSRNVIVPPIGEPVFTDPAAHDGATQLADVASLGRILRESVVRRKTATGEPFGRDEAAALAEIDARSQWAGHANGYRDATELARDVRTLLLGEKDPAASRVFWTRVRGGAFLVAGILLLTMSLFFAAFNLLVGLSMYGPSFLGLLIQNVVMQSAPTFLPGAYLAIAGLRSFARDGAQIRIRSNVSDSDAARELSIARTTRRTVWTRSLGSAPSIALCAIALGLGVVGVARLSTLPISDSRGAETARVAGFAMIAAFALCGGIGSWRWGVRAISIDGKAIGLDRLGWRRRLAIRAAGVAGSERLALDDDRLTYELRGPLGAVRREIPRSAIWDVAHGNSESGIEIAATGKPLRFGRGLAHRERFDLVDDLKRALDRSEPDDNLPEIARSPSTRRDAWAFWIFGVCLALPLALFEIPIPGVVQTAMTFAPDHDLHAFEAATQFVVAIVAIVGSGAMALGGWRLSRGLAGGRRMFQFGYYLLLAAFVSMWLVAEIAIAVLGTQVAPPGRVTFAMNVGAAAVSAHLVLGGLGVLWLFIRRDDSRLP